MSKNNKATRGEVFDAVDEERDYQDSRWTPETTTSGGRHSIGEWVVFIDDYLRQVKTELSRNSEPQASAMALDTMRKITALGVACMEQNGVVYRANGPRSV